MPVHPEHDHAWTAAGLVGFVPITVLALVFSRVFALPTSRAVHYSPPTVIYPRPDG